MPLSITFPDTPGVPREATLFATPPAAWSRGAAADLARRVGIGADVVDRGAWLVADDGRATLETYNASHSFRYERIHADGEPREPGCPEPDEVRRIADSWAREFGPRDSEFFVDSITEAELLVSVGAGREPERYVTAVQVNYRFILGGLPLLGPGAKMQVAVDHAGEVSAAYRFWREPVGIGSVRIAAPEEVFERFTRAPMFADLTDDVARAEVTEARLGYLAPPPTEPVTVLTPAYELRGVLSTETHPRYEFIVHVPAASIDGETLKRASRLEPVPDPVARVAPDSAQTRDHARSVLAPLEDEEAAAAVREALATVTRDKTVAADRTTVYTPMLRIEKPRQRDGKPARLVWVRIRDRDRRLVHEVSVEAGSVVEHVTSESASPPFSPAELDEATRLLEDAPRLRALLAESDVEIDWFNPGHAPERLLGARFVRVRDLEVFELITTAVVDLDEGTVVEGGEGDG